MASTSSDDESLPESERLSVEQGLSASSLAALMSFLQPTEGAPMEEEAQIDNSAIAVTYTQKDNDVIAATLKRLAEREGHSAVTVDKDALVPLQNSVVSRMETDLCERGVIRIPHALSEDLCKRCLERVGKIVDECGEDADQRFGNVLCRDNRFDAYLRPEGCVEEALQEIFKGLVGDLMHILHPDHPLRFHELSALVSDPGSDAQPCHPDTKYTEEPILWTAFCALQAVEEGMGETVFLPGTHNSNQVHLDFKNPERKAEFMRSREFQVSRLDRGDIALMDSRLLHFGGANRSGKRRVLLYFTLRTPQLAEEDIPPNGSLFPGLTIYSTDFS